MINRIRDRRTKDLMTSSNLSISRVFHVRSLSWRMWFQVCIIISLFSKVLCVRDRVNEISGLSALPQKKTTTSGEKHEHEGLLYIIIAVECGKSSSPPRLDGDRVLTAASARSKARLLAMTYTHRQQAHFAEAFRLHVNRVQQGVVAGSSG